MSITNRGYEWSLFQEAVFSHIETYTVPQYGDGPNDQVETWTAEDCIKNILKYCHRFSSGQRGLQERQRDLLKICHYACLANGKIKEEA